MYFVTTQCNVKIAVYDLNPNCKDCIVMIHGWPLSEKIFEYQQELLAGRNYRVITIDLRGFGNSDCPACGYDYNTLATDIHTIVRKLKLDCFNLVGFSMGGAIACRYMGLFNGFGVKKLCLLAAAVPRYTRTCDFPYGVNQDTVDDFIQLASTDRAQLCENFSRMLLHSPHSEAIKNWFEGIGVSATGIGTIKAAYSLRDEDCRSDLEKICVPTGIFHGIQDMVVPYELGVLQNKIIENSTLYTFQDSGHCVFYDELDLFNRCFLNFIEC